MAAAVNVTSDFRAETLCLESAELRAKSQLVPLELTRARPRHYTHEVNANRCGPVIGHCVDESMSSAVLVASDTVTDMDSASVSVSVSQ